MKITSFYTCLWPAWVTFEEHITCTCIIYLEIEVINLLVLNEEHIHLNDFKKKIHYVLLAHLVQCCILPRTNVGIFDGHHS